MSSNLMLSFCRLKPLSLATLVEDNSRCCKPIFKFVIRHLFGKHQDYIGASVCQETVPALHSVIQVA